MAIVVLGVRSFGMCYTTSGNDKVENSDIINFPKSMKSSMVFFFGSSDILNTKSLRMTLGLAGKQWPPMIPLK
jgi:hypothetical protein